MRFTDLSRYCPNIVASPAETSHFGVEEVEGTSTLHQV